MSTKRLHLLLAPKERFEPGGAGAFALNAFETSRASHWRSGITVFGSPVAQPFPGVSFQSLVTSRFSLTDRNVAMARHYANAVKHDPPDLVEIFNRPVMVDTIKRRLGEVPVVVHFGNDPRGMDGSRSVVERRALLARTAAIVSVSDFIRNCFLDGLDGACADRVHVIHTGVEASPEFPAAKEKRIIYVGRVVPDKGVLQLVQALARVLPDHPDWIAHIVGARWFGNERRLSPYEREVLRAAKSCNRIVPEGYRPHEEVIATLRKASIVVVPSCWDDPFPRTALEALAHGCALICSRRGGIPEIGTNRALFLENVSGDSLADALDHLVSDNEERRALQCRGWEDFPFEIRRTTARLDDLRAHLMDALDQTSFAGHSSLGKAAHRN